MFSLVCWKRKIFRFIPSKIFVGNDNDNLVVAKKGKLPITEYYLCLAPGGRKCGLDSGGSTRDGSYTYRCFWYPETQCVRLGGEVHNPDTTQQSEDNTGHDGNFWV